MPLPRKSALTTGRNSPSTSKKKSSAKKKSRFTTSVTRARRGEKLLLTCHPLMGETSVGIAAESLIGMMLYDELGRYLSVVDVRIAGHKVYGIFREMYEAAPYMFAPV